MSWSNKFIGIPQADLGRTREGADCWGLACVIYQEELGISLPEYLGYSSPDEQGECAAMIAGATSSPLWVPVTGPAVAFDIAVFRQGRFSSHVGIVVRHGLMIHIAAEDQAKLEEYHSGKWQHRFDGHYRHRSRVFETDVQRPVQIICEAAR
ncbi:NlpC/P60 family protein [Aquimixticola soesokkakensis]|uniref:NlpC/P60 family protein n=1 Tax=Aquimixticola soesokkakensis TaxID=1519096 RepID=A0A1Y5SER2_9RHOB|nr:NlpC/P60 family protein [Aquimixticola soesokkakensis]SLN37915.1 NlpC/P60 family protein [Aquimixticola soesokkakensis]